MNGKQSKVCNCVREEETGLPIEPSHSLFDVDGETSGVCIVGQVGGEMCEVCTGMKQTVPSIELAVSQQMTEVMEDGGTSGVCSV